MMISMMIKMKMMMMIRLRMMAAVVTKMIMIIKTRERFLSRHYTDSMKVAMYTNDLPLFYLIVFFPLK